MSSQDRKSRPIPAPQAAEFSRWRMPEMSEAERRKLVALARRTRAPQEEDPVEVVEEPLYAEKMTVAEWERLREEARQEGLAQGREEGIVEGRKIGQEQGLAEGLKQGEARIQKQLAELNALINQLQHPIRQQEQDLHQLLLKLVIRISSALVEAEYAQHSERVLEAINQAIDLIPPGSGTPVIALHPEDLVLVQPLADLHGWELRENAAARRGDLKLVAGSCVIQSDLEQKMLQVAGNLLQRATGDAGDVSD